MAALLTPELHWECPNCSCRRTTATPIAPGNSLTELHACPGLHGVLAPLVAAGTKCKVVAHYREDYIHKDLPQTDEDGKVVMSVTVERENGQDCVVLAPTAVIRL